MGRDLPSGCVTFLFTDVEGSTRLLHELGEHEYARTLAEHRRLVRKAFARRGGVEVDTQGDALFVAFPTATGAVGAAKEAQDALAPGPVRVRMGIHTGTPHLTDEGYVGRDVHKAARIAAAGHGGQVLLSGETRKLVDASVTDLGEHRVKDFDDPVAIFQLGLARFPPLKTISNTNLPRPASSFVGRERELADVVLRLRDRTRLLTLSGPGGSGKTRLAIEAATELVSEFKAGVFWVGLAPLRDPALVTEEIARTLGAKHGLASYIAEREMLLLLDNIEQVIESAPKLATLVETCPNLKVVVTSRELLRVRGEVEYAVPPLAATDAVTLFCDRSQLSEDSTIAELCWRLDSLPLAVELAAAHTKVLSPAQILERLSQRLDLLKGGRDAEARQRTLRATIQWSFDLLTGDERRLFARLSVFRGGCTLEAAEKVVGANLDTLRSLVEKSLVRFAGQRYWMLETIRAYALERLEVSGEAADIRRHYGEFFRALAATAEPHLLRGGSAEWLDRLQAEHDNFRAALDGLEAAGGTQEALQMSGALSSYWELRGDFAEGRLRMERALAADKQQTAARAKVLVAAADAAYAEGDLATAKTWAQESLALSRSLDDPWGVASAQAELGILALSEEETVKAERLLDESFHAFRELGDEHYALEVSRFLAWARSELGQRDRARTLDEETLSRAHALGNDRVEALSLDRLALAALEEGRYDDATSLGEKAYRIHSQRGDLIHMSATLIIFARILASRGRRATAVTVLSVSEAVQEDVGVSPSWLVKGREEALTSIHAELGDDAFAASWEQGRRLTAERAVALALDALD